MLSIQAILQNLARSQRDFLRAADAVPAEQWKVCPGEGRWSAGELVGHLITVEKTILSGADHLLQEPPTRLPFFKRLHVPLALVEARLIRRQTPLPQEPGLVREKEEMLADLREARERTMAFIEEKKGEDLRNRYRPHPFIGTLSVQEWLQFIAAHQIRHTKQMREIATALPKTITSLQK
jgi:uncharacterized damage-inducible protein DinB